MRCLTTLLERTPFIKYIYTSVKDVFDAFVGEKKKFDHPVLVQIYGVDVWEMGFITQADVSGFGLEGYTAGICTACICDHRQGIHGTSEQE